MKKIKVAVIGVGQMGNNHARVYSQIPHVDLIAVADHDTESAHRVSKQWNTKPYVNSLELLRNEKPDLVSVAVPTHLHYKVATEVIAHGCHLLLEKPIANNERQAIDIISLANKAKIKLMIGHIERFNPAVQALRKQLINKELGDIYYLETLRAGPPPIKPMKCGVTLDIAVHDLDIFRFITGSNIEHISATTSNIKNKKYEDWMHSTLSLSQNIMAIIHCDWLTPIKRRELSVIGAKGTFFVNYITQDLVFHKDNIHTDGSIRRDSVQHAINKREPLFTEIESFIKSIRNNERSPVSGEDGLTALRIANSILNSARQKKTIAISQTSATPHPFISTLPTSKATQN